VFFGGLDNILGSEDDEDHDLKELFEKRNEHVSELNKYNKPYGEFKSWEITEGSIRAKTTKFSLIVIVIAIVIVLDSLSVPFLVYKRIPGVYPFQFVTFSWLLAGAFLVGAKSRYIEEWPWHEFLSGWIVRRSVTELSQASGVSEQTVLVYLLCEQSKNTLIFRGYYSCAFTKPKEAPATGFNIDVPIKHSTLLAAGFIVLKVWSTKGGMQLLLHDARDNRQWDDKFLVSEKLKSSQEGFRDPEPRFKLSREYISDYQVLGQYVKKCVFF
jgi:hypothetical protein